MNKLKLISGTAMIVMAAYTTSIEAAVATNTKANAISVTNTVKDSTALKVVIDFFDSFKKGATPKQIAARFDVNADYLIPGDTKNVPWIGHKVGRAAIEKSFRLLRENITPEKLVFTDMLAKGNRVVVLGYLESRMKKNNKQMKSEFSIDIVVKSGLLTRYHLLENSFEVSEKAK